MEKVKYSKNGIPVYSYINETQHTFYISLFLRAGSMHESDRDAGITHFLEHIAIRNINHIMMGELYKLLDRYGLDFNAATYSHLVHFHISGAKAHFRIAADIISKLFLPITLPKAEIDAERERIRAEMREEREGTTLRAFTQKELFGDTALSRSIMGSHGTVSKISRRRLEDYRRDVMAKDNCFLYVTGSVSDDEMEYLSELVGEYRLNRGIRRMNLAPVPEGFGRRGARIAVKHSDYIKVRLSFDVDMSGTTLPELDLLYEQLLGGYSSEMFIELSEHRGLVYDISGAIEDYNNIAIFSIGYDVSLAHFYEALAGVIAILADFKREALPRDRFYNAAYIDNQMNLLDDDSELNFTLAQDNHFSELGYRDLEDRREAYRAVTPERLVEVARDIFTQDNLTVTIKGNKRKLDLSRIKGIVNNI